MLLMCVQLIILISFVYKMDLNREIKVQQAAQLKSEVDICISKLSL